MAEVLLKIGDGTGYADGDILCIFTDQRIAAMNAEIACREAPRPRYDGGGLLRDSLFAIWQAEVFQYQFDRISETEVRRTDKLSGEVRIFGPYSDGVTEYIDVQKYVDSLQEWVGEKGSETWFGGSQAVASQPIGRVWDAVEAQLQTDRNLKQNAKWQFGRLELCHYLALPIVPISEEKAVELCQPKQLTNWRGVPMWSDGDKSVASRCQPDDPTMLPMNAKKRVNRVDWKAVAMPRGISRATIQDQSVFIGDEYVVGAKKYFNSVDSVAIDLLQLVRN